MNKEGEIKLADFGVSEQLSGAGKGTGSVAEAEAEGREEGESLHPLGTVHKTDEVAGSPHWMAPEVVLEKVWVEAMTWQR